MNESLIILSGNVPGPLMDLSYSLPDLFIEGTPVGGFIIIHVQGSVEDLEKARGSIAPRYLSRSEDDEEIMVMSMAGAEAKVLDAASRDGMMLLPPIIWKQGRLYFRFLSFTRRSDSVLATMEDARLESKAMIESGRLEDEVLSSGLMLPTLTRKQGQVLLAALEAGYYESPRRATAGEVAASLGVARSSFEESLRSAESKIVRAVAPLVRMRALGAERGGMEAGAEALHLYARFSEDLGLFVRMALKDGRVASVGMSRQEPREPHEADHPYLARIIEHLSTGRDDLRDIPVQLNVTPFEMEVLEALREIPLGEVLTYGEVAGRIGHPRAARAVGSACARNPVPIVIPCHRVVPSSGGLGNYSGGAGSRTKEAILAKEGALDQVRKKKRRG